MSESEKGFLVGDVTLIPMLGDITNLPVDAVVRSTGNVFYEDTRPDSWASTFVREELAEAWKKHDLRLGDVIVTHARPFKARYLFSAVVVDWARKHESGDLVNLDVVASAAHRCIKVAGALGLESIAFTPWGTKDADAFASMVTAVMVYAIASELRNSPGALKEVYLVSDNKEHYEWFRDRAFVINLVSDQVSEIREIIDGLDIPESKRQQLITKLDKVGSNVESIQIFLGDQVSGDKTVKHSEAKVIGSGSIAQEGSVSAGEGGVGPGGNVQGGISVGGQKPDNETQ